VSEAKRNCGRATDRGEEARSEDVGPMNKNRIEACVDGVSGRLTAKLRWPSSTDVHPVAVHRRWMFLPGETSPHARKGDAILRSEESADAVVAVTKPMNESEAFVSREGQNERMG